jgi:hypothetical protein
MHLLIFRQISYIRLVRRLLFGFQIDLFSRFGPFALPIIVGFRLGLNLRMCLDVVICVRVRFFFNRYFLLIFVETFFVFFFFFLLLLLEICFFFLIIKMYIIYLFFFIIIILLLLLFFYLFIL